MEGVSAEGRKEDQIMVLQNKKEEDEERDWSELPDDIIGYIVGKLYWSDRIRICAVCKSWQQATLGCTIPTIDKAAWLMTYRLVQSHPGKGLIGELKLRDTSLGRVIEIGKDIEGTVSNIFFVTSRYGWVLFRKLGHVYCRKYLYLLYSPFTDEVIELPTLNLGYPVWSHILLTTFYLSSKGSECLVFSLHLHEDTIIICTCRPGDKVWKTYKFLRSKPIDWPSYPLSATYLGGCFYCAFACGALGVFDISSEEWKLLVKRWPGPRTMYIHGELVAIPRFPCKPYKRERVIKFDFSAKSWVEELNIKEMVHPDLRFLSSSQPLWGESTGDDHHLYVYLYSTRLGFLANRLGKRNLILIEPPLKGVWRRHHLLDHS
ncbi:hypothetical protein V6N13_046042 [Hibiscus sabdariffa]